MNPPGLPLTTDGESWFYAEKLIANPTFEFHYGADIIVGTNKVAFIDISGVSHEVEPDDLDLYWLSEIVDRACKT